MATQYSFYTIIADAYIYEGSEERTEISSTESWGNLFADAANATVNTTQFPIIVDSGTTLLYLPTGTSPNPRPPIETPRFSWKIWLTLLLDRIV